jgi:crotonobetainyl-CoA:carnitine CoA-transferase CaiB-like acyl-CoA transferase
VVNLSGYGAGGPVEHRKAFDMLVQGQAGLVSVTESCRDRPLRAYPTSDGQVLIGIQNDSGWRTRVTDVFGNPDLAQDPRFRTNVLRVEHRAECVAAQTAGTENGPVEALLPSVTFSDVEAAMGGTCPPWASRRLRSCTNPAWKRTSSINC